MPNPLQPCHTNYDPLRNSAANTQTMSFIRQKRLNEIASLQQASVHNTVYPLQKAEYAREVTDASSDGRFVFVLLTSSSPSGNVESRILTDIWRDLASMFGDLKFCEIRADMCIEGYPDRNTPTILVYRDGEIVKQVITLHNDEFNGIRTKAHGTSYSPWSHAILHLAMFNFQFCIEYLLKRN